MISVHAQTPRGRPLMGTGKGHHQRSRSNVGTCRGSEVSLELKDDKNVHHGACYWVTFNHRGSQSLQNHVAISQLRCY
jgi:hypothetical protein